MKAERHEKWHNMGFANKLLVLLSFSALVLSLFAGSPFLPKSAWLCKSCAWSSSLLLWDALQVTSSTPEPPALAPCHLYSTVPARPLLRVSSWRPWPCTPRGPSNSKHPKPGASSSPQTFLLRHLSVSFHQIQAFLSHLLSLSLHWITHQYAPLSFPAKQMHLFNPSSSQDLSSPAWTIDSNTRFINCSLPRLLTPWVPCRGSVFSWFY